MRSRTIIALLLAAMLTSITAIPHSLAAHMQQPATTVPLLPGATAPIKVASGNQTNASLACNIASYTNDDFEGTSSIEYLDFATNTTNVVPGNGLDRLSDTDGRRIVFTQLDANGDQLRIYDIASQSTTVIPGNGNSDPALGGNLVAFLHGRFSSPDAWEINVYDQSTGVTTQLTSDSMADSRPAISPDGSVIVWQKCQPNDTGCDIYSATQTSPGAFTTRLLTGAGEDRWPQTNGQFVVYISDKNGDNDIYFQRVGGSTEMRLALPGDQRDARISGNLIVFESQVADSSYDIFVYDLKTAQLYQVTNTPGVGETLSEIVTGCNGVNRIAYSIPGTFGDFDVWGFTFQLNDSVPDQISDLMALILSFNLHDGTENSLIAKLQDALTALNANDTATACISLTSFINASQAQSGKKLTGDQVKQLVDSANLIKAGLGCQ